MKKNYWIRCIVGLTSIVAVLLIRQVVIACGYSGPQTDEESYSLYAVDMMGPTRLSPFFCTISATYYKSPLDSLLPMDTTDTYLSNTAEWKAYLKNNPKDKDIDQLVYKVSASDIEHLRDLILSKPAKLPDSLLHNSAIAYLQKTKDLNGVNYLLFAKQCEPQVNVKYDGSGWGPLPARDTVLMKKLMDQGQQAWASATSDFIRFRYAFQVVRLAHYSGQYNKCLELYDKMMKDKNTHSIVSLWGVALRGGALTRLKRGGEAAYTFAMLFDQHFNFNWELYHQNFNWAGGDALPFCKNNHERAVVNALLGFGMQENLPVMKEVARLEPGSEYTDVLLTRHIRWMEHQLFPDHYPIYPFDFAKKVKLDEKSLVETRSFITGVIEKSGLKRPWLWEFSAGYISYFLNDQVGAKHYFDLAKTHAAGNDLLLNHIAALEILGNLDAAPVIDSKMASSLYADYKKLMSPEMMGYIPDAEAIFFYKLGLRYLSQQDTIHFLLCTGQYKQSPDLYNNPRQFRLDQLIQFLNRKDHNPFDDAICNGFQIHYPVSVLHEIRGTAFLEDYRFPEAIAEFEQAGKLKTLPADPFIERLKDCHDCDYAHPEGTSYTKLTLAKKIMELEQVSDASGPQQAQAAYQLGNAYYNMTYYGNTWQALAYSRSQYDTASQFYDCSKASYFYEKARKLYKDPEMQAHCAFMLAKCELTIGTPYDEGPKGIVFRKDLKAYQLLKGQYEQTKFYKDIIKECSYLRIWAKGK
jgi:hypothetical protein